MHAIGRCDSGEEEEGGERERERRSATSASSPHHPPPPFSQTRTALLATLLGTLSILSLAALAGSSSRALLSHRQRFAFQVPAGQTGRYSARAGYAAWSTNAGVRAGLTSPVSTLGGGLKGVGTALAAFLAASFVAGLALAAAALLGWAPAAVLTIPSAILATGLVGLAIAFYAMGAHALRAYSSRSIQAAPWVWGGWAWALGLISGIGWALVPGVAARVGARPPGASFLGSGAGVGGGTVDEEDGTVAADGTRPGRGGGAVAAGAGAAGALGAGAAAAAAGAAAAAAEPKPAAVEAQEPAAAAAPGILGRLLSRGVSGRTTADAAPPAGPGAPVVPAVTPVEAATPADSAAATAGGTVAPADSSQPLGLIGRALSRVRSTSTGGGGGGGSGAVADTADSAAVVPAAPVAPAVVAAPPAPALAPEPAAAPGVISRVLSRVRSTSSGGDGGKAAAAAATVAGGSTAAATLGRSESAVERADASHNITTRALTTAATRAEAAALAAAAAEAEELQARVDAALTESAALASQDLVDAKHEALKLKRQLTLEAADKPGGSGAA